MRHYIDRLIERMNYDDGLQQERDMVNSPSHYASGGIECIDAIQSALTPEEYRGFLKGNSMKYMWRLDKKFNSVEDAKKAKYYLTKLEECYEKQ